MRCWVARAHICPGREVNFTNQLPSVSTGVRSTNYHGHSFVCLSKYDHRIKNFPSNGPNNKNRHRLVERVGSWRDGKCTIGIWTYQKTNSKEGSTQWGLDLFPGKRHEKLVHGEMAAETIPTGWDRFGWNVIILHICHESVNDWLARNLAGWWLSPANWEVYADQNWLKPLSYWHIEHRVNVEMISTTWVIYSFAV